MNQEKSSSSFGQPLIFFILAHELSVILQPYKYTLLIKLCNFLFFLNLLFFSPLFKSAKSTFFVSQSLISEPQNVIPTIG